jgi:DNA-directed RNA polymerase specialized sigma24 family protein
MRPESSQPAVAEFFEEEHGRLVGFVRRWLDDVAAEEAEEWGAPLGTLLARKARALKKIRKYLEASGKSF